MKKTNTTRIYCIHCRQETNHKIIAKDSKSFTPEEYPSMSIDFADGAWEILSCCGCEERTFRETWSNSESILPDGNLEYTIQLYPIRKENMLLINPYYNTPTVLRRIYKEVIDCYNNDILTLCAVGLRVLIEGICLDNNIKNGPVLDEKSAKFVRKNNLQGKIAGMVEKEILTKKHAETLHELRFMGNEAAHKLQMPTSQELKLAIEITEHTIENLYELSLKAKSINPKKV